MTIRHIAAHNISKWTKSSVCTFEASFLLPSLGISNWKILSQNKQLNLLPPEPSNDNLELFLLQVLSTSSEDFFFLISFLSVNLSWQFAWTTDPSLATMPEPRSSPRFVYNINI